MTDTLAQALVGVAVIVGTVFIVSAAVTVANEAAETPLQWIGIFVFACGALLMLPAGIGWLVMKVGALVLGVAAP